MEMVSKEIYEQIKTQVLAEIEERKLNSRRIDLAAQAVFAQARKKYLDKIADKFGRGQWGNITGEIHNKFIAATKLALELIGERNARSAYLSGMADEANKKAEQIIEAMLLD